MMQSDFHELKEKPGACIECGNSPINHLESYCRQTLAVWFSEMEGKAKKGRLRFFNEWADSLLHTAEPWLFRFIAALPVSRFARDPTRARTYRSQVVWEEAQRRGIPMEQLTIFGSHTEIYRAVLQDRIIYFQSLPIPAGLARAAYDWIDDKYLLKQALTEAGIPTPRVASVKNLAEARGALQSMQCPVVVKPRAGSRARHTTVKVIIERDLEQAFRIARRLCRYVVVEEFLEGSVCRGTVVNGSLVGFFQGDAPTIIGDGQSTIRQLVVQANTEKPERVLDIQITLEHERFLGRGGYSLDSVPIHGEGVLLSHRTGRLYGGRTRELLGAEHPKLRAYLERAACSIGAPVVGFDLIIKDPESDPDTQKWGIIEANSLPFIDLHYLPLEGKPSNVAAAIWDLWDVKVA